MAVVFDAGSAVVYGLFRRGFGQVQGHGDSEVGVFHGPFSGLRVYVLGVYRLFVFDGRGEQADSVSADTGVRQFYAEFVSIVRGDG